MTDTLGISIPAYNRPDALGRNLKPLLPTLAAYNIPIFISDDSSNDDVRTMVESLRSGWSRIYYTKNHSPLGHDKNFLSSLRTPNTDYVWLIGDRVKLSPDSIAVVSAAVRERGPAVIAVGKQDRDIDIESGEISDCTNVLALLGWHLTYTGATVYPRELIESIDEKKLVESKNFPQIHLIFSWLSNGNSLFWIEKKLLEKTSLGRSYWADKAIEVFIDDWEAAINALPPIYSEELKSKVIYTHSHKTQLFSAKLLLRMRANGCFSGALLLRKRRNFFRHSTAHPITILIIALIPRFFLLIIFWIRDR